MFASLAGISCKNFEILVYQHIGECLCDVAIAIVFNEYESQLCIAMLARTLHYIKAEPIFVNKNVQMVRVIHMCGVTNVLLKYKMSMQCYCM